MKEIHYFQRFSKREDVATNNTLLLLTRLQHHSGVLLERVLGQLLGSDDLTIGPRFSQQVHSKSATIPDGLIIQDGFRIVIETKLHAAFDQLQLLGHVEALRGAPPGRAILFLLGTGKPHDLAAIQAAVDAAAGGARAVRVCSATFGEVVAACEEVVPEGEYLLREIVDDYRGFCVDEKLLADQDADFLLVGCSQSLPANLRFRLYYDSKPPTRQIAYIGFYADKAIRAVGKISKVVQVDVVEGALLVTSGTAIDIDEAERIRRAMTEAESRGWDITTGHCFFLASEVAETEFRKSSKGPLQGRRYYGMRMALGLSDSQTIPALATAASELFHRTWE